MTRPQPSGEFEWVQESWGAALRCWPLEEIARHCFSTRELDLDGTPVINRQSWTALARALGVEEDRLVRMRQVHGAGIVDSSSGAATPDRWPEGDIAVSGDASRAATVRTADCVPVLLADSRSGGVAAVHAGWKGTAAGAVGAAVDALSSRYQANPDDIVAAVGPSIGPCCYVVGPELRGHFAHHPDAPAWFSEHPRPRLDLWRATRDQLIRAGVPAASIHVCGLCTADHPSLFHSYRRDGARAGRLVAAIRSGPGRTP